MNMVKKATLTASILLAVALTFGCSDDKDDDKDDKNNPQPPPAATEPKWCVLASGGYVQCIELDWADEDGDVMYTKETCETAMQAAPNAFKLETDKPSKCNVCYGGPACD